MDNKKLQAILLNRINEAQLFTNRFASFNKADYEVLMFTVFLDCLEDDARDYDISIALGIPESKVRTLRIKSQLQYPREIKWEEKLVTAIEHGSYDPITKMITVTQIEADLDNDMDEYCNADDYYEPYFEEFVGEGTYESEAKWRSWGLEIIEFIGSGDVDFEL